MEGAQMDQALSLLFELQELDSALDREKAELEAIPGERRIVDEEVTRAREEFSAVEASLSGIVESQAQCEREKAEARARLAEYRTKLLSLKTNTEYRAMLEQMAWVEKRLDELDSRTVELLYAEDDSRKAVEEAGRKLGRYEERAARKRQMLDGREQELVRGIEELGARREELAPRVNIRLLRKYEQLRASGKSAAVVLLSRGACGGCHTNIPPQNAVEIGRGETYNCPICGRYVVAGSSGSS